uniref:Uncharacterized protein n=1 Tax=Rhizophora mucronata TaxID=61149 RepID=A0A2P2Q1B9_RHIMU
MFIKMEDLLSWKWTELVRHKRSIRIRNSPPISKLILDPSATA